MENQTQKKFILEKVFGYKVFPEKLKIPMSGDFEVLNV